jgi:hypothetical protein
VPFRAVASLLVLAAPLAAQESVSLAELVEALSRSAANFAITAPGLGADETLDQRGRRGFIEVLNGKVPTARNSELKLPEEFREHHVVSHYALTPSGEAAVLHETRTIVELDGVTAPDPHEARHPMTIGLKSRDDDFKRQALEDFEHDQLEGAVTDFGQLLLLFTSRHLADYEFTLREPLVLTYRQTSGTQGVTLFEQRTAQRQNLEGEILFSADDLLPIRITLKTRKAISKNFSIDTEASVDYIPSRFGLVPAAVSQHQSLNSFLMVENNLHYSNYHHSRELIP